MAANTAKKALVSYTDPHGVHRTVEVADEIAVKIQTDSNFATQWFNMINTIRESEQTKQLRAAETAVGLSQAQDVLSDPDLNNHKSAETATAGSAPGPDRLPDPDVNSPKWTSEEAKFMMNLRLEAHNKFLKAESHISLWSKIAKDMCDAGYDITAIQCQNKYKQVKRRYIETVDHNGKTGADPVSCPFFEELDKIFGSSDNSKPLFTVDNRVPLKRPKMPKEPKPDASSEPKPDASLDSDDDQAIPLPGRKKRAKTQSPMLTWLEKFQKRQENRDTKREKQHEEKMNRMDRFLDILSNQQKNN